jgi:hypothetical protein
MEQPYLSRVRVLFEPLSARLQKFQTARDHTTRDPEKLKIIRGTALIAFTFLLGYLSLQTTESAAIVRYRDSTWPEPKIWRATLLSYGFIPATPIGNYTSLLADLPSAFSEDSSLWYSVEHKAIYISKSPFSDDATSELWTLGPPSLTKAPGHWENLGTGMNGIEKMTKSLDQLAPGPKFLAGQFRPQKASNWVDPKEIRY